MKAAVLKTVRRKPRGFESYPLRHAIPLREIAVRSSEFIIVDGKNLVPLEDGVHLGPEDDDPAPGPIAELLLPPDIPNRHQKIAEGMCKRLASRVFNP